MSAGIDSTITPPPATATATATSMASSHRRLSNMMSSSSSSLSSSSASSPEFVASSSSPANSSSGAVVAVSGTATMSSSSQSSTSPSVVDTSSSSSSSSSSSTTNSNSNSPPGVAVEDLRSRLERHHSTPGFLPTRSSRSGSKSKSNSSSNGRASSSGGDHNSPTVGGVSPLTLPSSPGHMNQRRVRSMSLGGQPTTTMTQQLPSLQRRLSQPPQRVAGAAGGSSPRSSTNNRKKIMLLNDISIKAQCLDAQRINDSMIYIDGPQIYTCGQCRTHLTSHDDIISKSFHGRHGRAYLFDQCVNITVGPAEDRLLITGLHSVCDIYCKRCKCCIGWTYKRAYETSQKYKEGKFIIEKINLHLEDGTYAGYSSNIDPPAGEKHDRWRRRNSYKSSLLTTSSTSTSWDLHHEETRTSILGSPILSGGRRTNGNSYNNHTDTTSGPMIYEYLTTTTSS